MQNIETWSLKERQMILNKKMFFTSGDSSGCSHYRTELPAKFLGYESSQGFPTGDPKLEDSDIIFIQRASHEYFLKWIPYIQSKGKKVIFDIDDNLWKIPVTNPASHAFSSRNLKLIKSIMQLCNGITVSTQPLKDFFLDNRFNTNIHVIPNMINNVFENPPKKEKVRIGWIGTSTHAGDFSKDLIFALRELKKRNDCELVFMGYNPLKDNSEFHKFISPEKYLEYVNLLALDIGLCVTEDNDFNRCKSNIKYLEYSACGVTTIANSVYPYANTIKHGDTGLILDDESLWIEYIVDLINRKDLREYYTLNAKGFVKENFTYEHNGQMIIDKYERLIESL